MFLVNLILRKFSGKFALHQYQTYFYSDSLKINIDKADLLWIKKIHVEMNKCKNINKNNNKMNMIY